MVMGDTDKERVSQEEEHRDRSQTRPLIPLYRAKPFQRLIVSLKLKAQFNNVIGLCQ